MLALVAVSLVLLLSGGGRATAQSAERITDYRTTIAIQDDGRLEITEVIAYDFGSNERHGIFRDIPTRFPFDSEHERVYPLHVRSVTADPESTPTDTKVSEVDNVTRIRIGDPDVTITGQHTYVITYEVEGALNHFEDHDELFWNAIGTEWDVPIERGEAIVTAPADITQVACFAGPQGSSLPCTSANVDGSTARFTQDDLGFHSGLTVVVAVPPGAVNPTPVPILEEKLTFKTAFDPAPQKIATGAIVGVAGIVGLVFLLRRGRDRRFVGSATDQAFGNVTGEEEPVPLRGRTQGPVEFEPPDGIRPGQLGTLIDEQANLLDVTATIIDLAVRGFILIQEVPGEDGKHKPDYRLTDLGKSRRRSAALRGAAARLAVRNRLGRRAVRPEVQVHRQADRARATRCTTTRSTRVGSHGVPITCGGCGAASGSSCWSSVCSSPWSRSRSVGDSRRSRSRSSACCS